MDRGIVSHQERRKAPSPSTPGRAKSHKGYPIPHTNPPSVDITALLGDATPLQSAVLSRTLALLWRVKSRDSEVLQRALSAPDEGSFLVALADDLSPAEDAQHPGITAALRRGILLRNRILTEDGGTVSAEEAAALMGLGSRQAIYHQTRRRLLLSVPVGHRGIRFPVWQFQNGRAVPGLDQVLKALPDQDPWSQLLFFVSKSILLGGLRPLDILLSGDIDAVVRAARSNRAPGR